MTTTINAGAGITPGCTYTMIVNTTGGTAPYSVKIFHDGILFTQVSNDADGDLFITDPVSHTSAGWTTVTAQVTDALGCMANGSDPGDPYNTIYTSLQLTFSDEIDCTSGNRWLLALIPVTCAPPSYFQYTLNGWPWSNFMSNWTYVSMAFPGTALWKYNTPLLPGGCALTLVSSCATCAGSSTWELHDAFATASYSSGITPGDCGANVSIRAALQGALPGGTLMHDSLRVKNLIPTTQPYTALGYSYTAYTGATTIAPALLTTTGNNAIVDWVVVELRNSANSAQVLFSKPALLQRDGDVVDLDGDSYVNFPAASGNYYVALRHRNHLGIMTSTTRTLTASPTSVDFRLSSTGCYGTNARVVVGSVQCLWPGDANGNSTVAYTGLNNDRDLVLDAIGGVVPTNTLNNVYDRRDVNMDGTVKYTGLNNDRDVILNTIGGVVPTNVRAQQLP